MLRTAGWSDCSTFTTRVFFVLNAHSGRTSPPGVQHESCDGYYMCVEEEERASYTNTCLIHVQTLFINCIEWKWMKCWWFTVWLCFSSSTPKLRVCCSWPRWPCRSSARRRKRSALVSLLTVLVRVKACEGVWRRGKTSRCAWSLCVLLETAVTSDFVWSKDLNKYDVLFYLYEEEIH